MSSWPPVASSRALGSRSAHRPRRPRARSPRPAPRPRGRSPRSARAISSSPRSSSASATRRGELEDRVERETKELRSARGEPRGVGRASSSSCAPSASRPRSGSPACVPASKPRSRSSRRPVPRPRSGWRAFARATRSSASSSRRERTRAGELESRLQAETQGLEQARSALEQAIGERDSARQELSRAREQAQAGEEAAEQRVASVRARAEERVASVRESHEQIGLELERERTNARELEAQLQRESQTVEQAQAEVEQARADRREAETGPPNAFRVHLAGPLSTRTTWSVEAATARGGVASVVRRRHLRHRRRPTRTASKSAAGPPSSDRRRPAASASSASRTNSRGAGGVQVVDHWTIGPRAMLDVGGQLRALTTCAIPDCFSPAITASVSPGGAPGCGSPRPRDDAPRRRGTPAAGLRVTVLPPQPNVSAMVAGSAASKAKTPRRHTLEQDIATFRVAVTHFRQNVDGQLATVFDPNLAKGQRRADLSHYGVASVGDFAASGCGCRSGPARWGRTCAAGSSPHRRTWTGRPATRSPRWAWSRPQRCGP